MNRLLISTVCIVVVNAVATGCNGGGTADTGADVTDVLPADAASPDVVDVARPSDANDVVATDGSPAGEPCTTAAQCGSPSTWQCYTPVVDGLCTHTCAGSGMQATEQMQCGGAGSTCVTIDDGASAMGYCERTCDPTEGAAACRPGFVCTGWWFTHAGGTPDRTGCWTHCATDADCATGSPCNARSGVCGDAPVDGALLADGEPCNPMDVMAMNVSTDCRSRQCYSTSTTDPTAGICGSLLNLTVTTSCPDGPTLQPGSVAGDELALCLYKTCTTDCDCTAPLLCATANFFTGNVCRTPAAGEARTMCTGDAGTSDASADATAGDAGGG